MTKFFKIIHWLAVFILVAVLLPWLAGCRGSEGANPVVQPAGDRPTFVWIFSDP